MLGLYISLSYEPSLEFWLPIELPSAPKIGRLFIDLVSFDLEIISCTDVKHFTPWTPYAVMRTCVRSPYDYILFFI